MTTIWSKLLCVASLLMLPSACDGSIDNSSGASNNAVAMDLMGKGPPKRTCPGGKVLPVNQKCPPYTPPPPPPSKTCPDGSVVLSTMTCPSPPPPPTQTCWDGSVILASATCPIKPPPPPPVATRVCVDGKTYKVTDVCALDKVVRTSECVNVNEDPDATTPKTIGTGTYQVIGSYGDKWPGPQVGVILLPYPLVDKYGRGPHTVWVPNACVKVAP